MQALVREIVTEPLVALAAVRDLPLPFLLHSAQPGGHARWSFFGADPFEVVRGDDALAPAELGRRWRESAPAERHAPFQGGLVGYWAYELGAPRRACGLPLLVAGAYDVTGAIDHASGRAWLFSSGLPCAGRDRVARAQRRLDAFAARLEGAPAATGSPRAAQAAASPRAATGGPRGAPHAGPLLHARSSLPHDAYCRAVDAIRDHIRRGDIFQANLTQRWSLPRPAHADLPMALARAAAAHTSAPFAAFIDAGDHAVVSASPERFLSLRGDHVEARPIKGTRPRGADAAADRAEARALLASAKDRAENIMIVDVLRNDIGRVCRWGSVEAPELCALEAFPQVWHLTSTVAGRLATGRDAFDLLDASFPGGSITGAPKLRAMEILAALEPVPRHVYTGAIGYVDWNGDADWSIAIRTAVLTRDEVLFSAGGGITADSEPEAEYEESLHKAEGLRRALSAVVGPVTLADAPSRVG